MNVLFVHQNFPGQFKFLAPAIAQNRANRVVALAIGKGAPSVRAGVELVPYQLEQGTSPSIHRWVSDFETKVIRGEAAFKAAQGLKGNGFNPDVIVAHPGWGESLFLKDVWPDASIGIYCEFFYSMHGADVGFDPEFAAIDEAEACRIRLKNTNNLLHFEFADGGISPTRWQASTFPEPFRSKITVVHDGINTDQLTPDDNAFLVLNGHKRLSRDDEIITFVNRNLEPYRGYHIFMRALPDLLKRRPNAYILIVGGNQVSYGSRPTDGRSWKDILISEVRPKISDSDWARVFFLGNIEYKHFVPLLQVSTVHVYLTYPFVLSWSLLEAMSCGCAIVASRTAPLLDAIAEGDTGLLVDFFDGAALVESVCRLADNPEERRYLGERARAFARANFDLTTTCLPAQLAWIDGLASL